MKLPFDELLEHEESRHGQKRKQVVCKPNAADLLKRNSCTTHSLIE